MKKKYIKPQIVDIIEIEPCILDADSQNPWTRPKGGQLFDERLFGDDTANGDDYVNNAE